MLPALRLLAVYLVTASAVLLAAHRWLRSIRTWSALLLLFGPFLMTGRAMLTAGVYAPLDLTYVHEPFRSLAREKGTANVRTPILSDVVFSMIPWRKDVREAVKNGRLPLWNRFQLAGEPLLAVQQHGAFHPETPISFLLPLAQAWTFMMSLRFFVSLLCGYLFFRDVVDRELPALVGGAAWAFCDFLVFYEGYPLSPAVGPLPLLLLGLRRLAREPGRGSVAITVAALCLMVTAGHPESLLHGVAAGGVYFLCELFWNPGNRRRVLVLSLVSGVLALGLCAVVLLPFIESLPQTIEHSLRSGFFTGQKKSVSLYMSIKRSAPSFVPYAFGLSGHGQVLSGFHEPSGYAGSVLWPLALVGLWSQRREKWGFLILAALGLTVSVGLVGITDAVSALPLFRIALNQRLVFLFGFAVVALAVLGVERLSTESCLRVGAASVLSMVIFALLFWRVRPTTLALGFPPAELTRRFLWQAVPLLLVFCIAALARKRAVFAASAVLALLIAQRRAEAGDVYPTYSAAAFAPHLSLLDAVPRGEPYRFAAVGYEFIPNVSSLYELEDVRSYSSMTLLPMVQTFPLWCVPQPVWFNRIDDPTRPFLSFLNVRYILLSESQKPPAGWAVLARTAGGTLVENPGALPRVFIPESVVLIASPGAQLDMLGRISDFRRLAVVERDGPGEDVPAGVPNGEARARVSSYGAQQITVEVNARKSAVVATSIPRWRGWKLSLDGHRWPTFAVNRAFVGFQVPPGQHSARLRYLPDSVVTGIGISAVSLVAGCVLAVWRRSRSVRQVIPGWPASSG